MKLRYLSLLLFVFIFFPVYIVNATESHPLESVTSDNLKSFNAWQIKPEDEPFLLDAKGRVTKGVIYHTEKVSGKSRIYKQVISAQDGGFLYYDNSRREVRCTVPGQSVAGNVILEERYFCVISDSANLNSLGYTAAFVFPIKDKSFIDIHGGSYQPTDGSEYVSSGSYFATDALYLKDSLYINIPIFKSSTNCEEYTAYANNGDYSGASNADDVNTAKKEIYPDNKYEMEKGPYLEMDSFDGTNLTIRPASDAYCTWSYTPQRTDLYTDLTLDVIYDYQLSIEILNNANVGKTMNYKASGSFPLSDYNFSYNCYPVAVCGKYGWFTDPTATALMFGGSAKLNAGASFGFVGSGTTDLVEVTGSYLTVTFKLKGKYNGDWVNGPAVIEKVDLINRTCSETPAYSDDDGNYTVDETTPPVTKDENGNVIINNNVSGGGGGSSATGGNASVTIGDITTSSTFRFPDKITVDLNINGLDGTGGGGSSGGVSEDGTKKWYDRLLDALSSLLEFLTGAVTKLFEALGDLLTTFAESVGDFVQYLFEGFGLFSGDMDDLLAESYSFLPPDVWRLITFGIATVILTAVVKKFFGS